MKKDLYAEIRDFVKRFNIVEADTKQTPISEEELSMLQIQLEAAKFIANEVSEICQQNQNLNKSKLYVSLLKNWNTNIENFIKLLLNE